MIGGPPRIGWVVRYEYDWGDEAAPEAAAQVKERPAVIVLSVRRTDSVTLVRVVPITHRLPADTAIAVEIPAATKLRLGMDSAPSWVVLNHANEFVWPGPDLRPVPGRAPPTIYYGPLPPALFSQLRQTLLALLKAGRAGGRLRGG
jgi:hypothetical protein